MAIVSETGQKIPLGVGAILRDSFAILFGNAFKVLALVSAAAIAIVVLSEFVFTFDGPWVWTGPLSNEGSWFTINLAPYFIHPILYGLMIGLVMRLTYGAKRGQRHAWGVDLKSAWRAIIPVFVSSLVFIVLRPINMMALWINALWIYAVFFTIASVAVLEPAGWRSVARSVVLTRGYRWPILGLFIIMVVAVVLLSYIGHFLWLAATLALPQPYNTNLAWRLTDALTTGLGYAFGGTVAALIYARLSEIKEGIAVDQVATFPN